MTNVLKKIALLVGLWLLFWSMYWSQDGFNFDVAGDSGYSEMAVISGWGLAVAVTTMQFIFATNYRDLNASLIFLGILAYIYSIYTNYQGILHFQGLAPSKLSAGILGFVIDGAPEPMIAWALGESLAGDAISNFLKSLFGDLGEKPDKKSNFGQKSPDMPAFPRFFTEEPGNSERKKMDEMKETKPSIKFIGNRGGKHGRRR